MDPSPDIVPTDLLFDEEAAELWESALPHLPDALNGSDAVFLASLEASARSAGLLGSVPVRGLLDAYTRGDGLVRARMRAWGSDQAEEYVGRMLALEHIALLRVATGFSDGLTEALGRVRRLAEESSPFDLDSGAVKAAEFAQRLSLEVERCRRMDLSLGLLEVAPESLEDVRVRRAKHRRAVSQQIVTCLRENLRRYDNVGLTDAGAYVLVLPDISRRGLVGAAERIRQQLAAAGLGTVPHELTMALAHYDCVDVNAREMLAGLSRSLDEARGARRPLTWA